MAAQGEQNVEDDSVPTAHDEEVEEGEKVRWEASTEDIGARAEQGCLRTLLEREDGPEIGHIVMESRSSVPAPQGAITKSCLLSLEPRTWLDDDALNSLIELYAEDGKEACVLGSHTWTQIWAAQVCGDRMPNRMDLSKLKGIRRVVLPVNQSNYHWLGVCVWLPPTASGSAHALLYDPAGGSLISTEMKEVVSDRLSWWLIDHLGMSTAVFIDIVTEPQQRDGFNCGIYVAKWALSVISSASALRVRDDGPGFSCEEAEAMRNEGRLKLAEKAYQRGALGEAELNACKCMHLRENQHRQRGQGRAHWRERGIAQSAEERTMQPGFSARHTGADMCFGKARI